MNRSRQSVWLDRLPLAVAGLRRPVAAHTTRAITSPSVSPIMPATSLAPHEHLSVLTNRYLFDEGWLFQPVPWRQRWLAILVVGLFVVACVPVCAILVVSMALQPLMPASPAWRHAQATVLVGLCLLAEVAWFGGLVWWLAALIA